MPTSSENFPRELRCPGSVSSPEQRGHLTPLGASNLLTGSAEPKDGHTPKPELPIRYGVQAELGQADVQTPLADMTTTILYAKPVCYEHLHPNASGTLPQE